MAPDAGRTSAVTYCNHNAPISDLGIALPPGSLKGSSHGRAPAASSPAQRVISPANDRWSGAGSNRRPSAFQPLGVSAVTPVLGGKSGVAAACWASPPAAKARIRDAL